MPTTTVNARWMIRGDMPRVLQIEQESFTDPWTPQDFNIVLGDRQTIGLVAEMGEKLLGYAVYRIRVRSIHLLTIAVDPLYRRRKVGAFLVDHLKQKLGHKKGRTRIYLEVDETNLQGQLFFRAQAFKATRVLRNFFDLGYGIIHDAYRMEYRIKESD